jgi:hypothetical protein
VELVMVDWSALRHFTPGEFGVDADLMHPVLLLGLDGLRERLGRPILIHPDPATELGHVVGSQHPRGRAVDCHAPGLPLLDFWLAAEATLAFSGIGIYPYWANPGLHVDVREGLIRARWWRDQAGLYHPVTAGVLYDLMRDHAFMA